MSQKQIKREKRRAPKIFSQHYKFFVDQIAKNLCKESLWVRLKIAWRIIFNGSL